MTDHEKAFRMYERRNKLLKRILKTTTTQLEAIRGNRTEEFLRSCDERERYIRELVATETDIKRVVDKHIRSGSREVAQLNETAGEILHAINSLEPEIRERLELRMRDVEVEIGKVRQGKDTLKAYRAHGESKRGQGMSRRG